MYAYASMHVVAISEKRGHGFETVEGSIWKGLEGKKGTEKRWNYGIKIKLKASMTPNLDGNTNFRSK